MKRFLSIFTIILMLASFSVSAAMDSAASYRYDSVNNGFYVYGTIDDTKIGDDITIEAYLNDKVFDTVITQTVLKDNKAYFESDLIVVDSSKASGKIKFKVYSANNVINCETKEFSYYGISDNFDVLKAVVEKMSAGDFDGMKTVLSGRLSETDPYNYELLGIDYSLISSLSQSAGKTVGDYAKTVTITLPENVNTDENKATAFEKLVEFKSAYHNMAMIGNFADISSESDFTSWYTTYTSDMDLENYNDKWYSYFKDTYKENDFYTIFASESQNISEIDKIKDRLLEVGGLTAVKRGNAASVKNVFSDFSSLITISYTLNDVQKATVYGQLAGNAFGTFEKLSAKYNELAYALLYSAVPITPGSSSSSGGSSGGSVTVAPKPDTTPANKNVFSDMASAKWAETAVYALYEKGIVSGKTATQFYPNDNITRAEFVKLLVMASGKEIVKSSQIFADVTSDAWYFDYVNTAYNMGLVTGDDKGNFNPDSQITREDMATMIYRLMGNNEIKGDVNVFSDANTISDYAKTAVAYLNANGVVNGMGDGTFAPKNPATRAQAAQMIYNIIK